MHGSINLTETMTVHISVAVPRGSAHSFMRLALSRASCRASSGPWASLWTARLCTDCTLTSNRETVKCI